MLYPYVNMHENSGEDHLETLEQVYEDRFERIERIFRPHVKKVMERYPDCGNLLSGDIFSMTAGFFLS